MRVEPRHIGSTGWLPRQYGCACGGVVVLAWGGDAYDVHCGACRHDDRIEPLLSVREGWRRGYSLHPAAEANFERIWRRRMSDRGLSLIPDPEELLPIYIRELRTNFGGRIDEGQMRLYGLYCLSRGLDPLAKEFALLPIRKNMGTEERPQMVVVANPYVTVEGAERKAARLGLVAEGPYVRVLSVEDAPCTNRPPCDVCDGAGVHLGKVTLKYAPGELVVEARLRREGATSWQRAYYTDRGYSRAMAKQALSPLEWVMKGARRRVCLMACPEVLAPLPGWQRDTLPGLPAPQAQQIEQVSAMAGAEPLPDEAWPSEEEIDATMAEHQRGLPL